MKTYQKNGHQYFYDRHERFWVIHPIDDKGNLILWDEKGNPIEATYIVGKENLQKYLTDLKPVKGTTEMEGEIQYTLKAFILNK